MKRHRTLPLTAATILLCLSTPALATVTIIAGDHLLLPNTPGQVVQILISSDVPQGIQSADLGLTIGNGFSGPVITDIDMTSPGTIFGDAPAGNTGQSDFEVFPTRTQLSSIATNAGDTSPAAGGILAFVTLDTTGVLPGIYDFELIYAPFFLPTATNSIPAQATVLVDGQFGGHIPEPSSLVLGGFAMGTLGLLAIRRSRRRNR